MKSKTNLESESDHSTRKSRTYTYTVQCTHHWETQAH